MSPRSANLLLLACAAVWGFGYLFQKSAMAHVGPLLFVAARCGLAALVLAAFAWAEHGRSAAPPAATFNALAVLAGAVLAIASIVQQLGIATASVTNSAFLTSLYVVLTPLLAWPLLGQPPHRAIWLAVALSLVGAWLLGGGSLTPFGRGEWLVLAATLLWAAHVVVLGKAAPFERPIMLTALQFAIASGIAMACAAAWEPISLTALARAAIEIAYVGILSSALTFTIFAAALRRTTAAAACLVIATEAPFAALGAYLVLGETMSIAGAVGGTMMLAAVVVAHRSALHKT